MGRTGPYLAAGRPGPGSRGPSGAGSPSGRRGRQLQAERAQAGRQLSEPGPLLPSAAPRLHAWGAGGTPSVRAGSPRMTRLVPLVMKGNPGTGSQAAQPDPDPGLWALALLAQTRCPAPRSREAPQRPPRTHCLPAGARAPPETGSRGVSGPPLLTRGSWIHTERQRAAAAGTPLAI